MKKNHINKKLHKLTGQKIDLTEDNLNTIKTISEFLFMEYTRILRPIPALKNALVFFA